MNLLAEPARNPYSEKPESLSEIIIKKSMSLMLKTTPYMNTSDLFVDLVTTKPLE